MSQLTLSDTGFLVLLGLAQTPATPQHGYGLIQAVNGQLAREALLPAALYTTLPKLLKAGLVMEVQAPADNTDVRRRYYQLTGPGIAAVRQRAAEQHTLARMILDLPEQLTGVKA